MTQLIKSGHYHNGEEKKWKFQKEQMKVLVAAFKEVALSRTRGKKVRDR